MLFVTAESSCKTCRSALFLQRLDGQVFCHPCGALTPLAPDFGAKALRAALALGRGLTDGATNSTSVDGFRGKAKLMAFGAEGFTFLKNGGGVQRFDLGGNLVFDSAGAA